MDMGASSKVCESGASKYGLPGKVWGPMGKYGRLAQPSMPLVKYGSLSQWGGRCWASNLSSTRPDCPILLPHTRQSRFPSYFLSYFHCPILLPHQVCTKLWIRDVFEKLRNNNDAYVGWSQWPLVNIFHEMFFSCYTEGCGICTDWCTLDLLCAFYTLSTVVRYFGNETTWYANTCHQVTLLNLSQVD